MVAISLNEFWAQPFLQIKTLIKKILNEKRAFESFSRY